MPASPCAPAHSTANSGEPVPLSLHHLYHQQAAAGYSYDLTLHSHQVQKITANLRGINAIAAVLIAGDDGEQLELGAYLRGGLIEAISALSWDLTNRIERDNERAAKKAQGTQA